MADLILPDSENQSKGYVADGDTKTRVQLTATPSGAITLSPNENSPYGYITDAGGKKHRVLLTAARGQPLMKCIFTDGVLTRLSFVGFWNLQG